MLNKKQIIVFDLDGTLINSAPDLCYALNKTLAEINIPLIVRLAGTNVEKGIDILNNSGLDIISADNLGDAAKKVVSSIREA